MAQKLVVKTFRISLFAIWLMSWYAGYCQSQITFRQLSVKEGLSQNSAISIAQDSTGYLWIATQDGLNKYDGRQFTVFPYTFLDITKPNYSNLGKVYRDKQHRLWIIPSDSIPRKFNPKQDRFEPLHKIGGASVLFQDASLNLWIGTYTKGLYRLSPEDDIPTQVLTGELVKSTIYNIAQTADGSLLISLDRGLIEVGIDNGKAKHINFKDRNGQPILENFSDVVFDRKDRQWIGTFGDGLYFRKNKDSLLSRISKLPFTDPLPIDLNIIDLFIDSKDRLWVATYGHGLFLIDFKNTKILQFKADKHNPKALHYNDVLCIYEDDSGILWFGTDGAGLSYYDEYLEKFNSLTNYQTPENINIDVVRAITVDQDNSVWVGTSGKGLTQYRKATNSWRAFKAKKGDERSINSDRIMSLLIDDDNDLWIGTQGGGLSIMNSNGTFSHYNDSTEPSLSAKTIWCIYKDEKQHIWLGTREEGLIAFDKSNGEIKKLSKETLSKGVLPSNNIRVITSDKRGNLWLGTESDGIVFYDGNNETFRAYRKQDAAESIPSNNIKTLYYDPEGILWIGTNGSGLTAFDTKNNRYKSYTMEQGLANNVIYAILPDQSGNLWLSSNKGITKFTLDAWELEPTIKNYTNYDGLATEFNTGAYHLDSKGTLYFGGLEGFYWFDPSEITENTVLPKTTITSLSIFDKSQPMEERLTLPYDQNTVSFTFSGLQYSLPDKNQYQYRLLNYDEEWVLAGNNNFARYTRLPPGEYNFQVKSSNYDGIWNDEPVSFSFKIASPWYLAPLAKMMYLLVLLAIVSGIYRYLKWRWKMKVDLQIKIQEAHRLKRLHHLKSKLYTDISHEFRTPLTLISGPIDAKLNESDLSETDYANFSMIKRNTNRLIKLVDQLLELAKLEKGNVKLKPIKGNLGQFLSVVASSFEYKALQRKITYTTAIGDIGVVSYDENAVEKILSNLLSNAFKYGKGGGICHIEAYKSEGKVYIGIKNTVDKGLDVDLTKLFDRFYQKNEFSEGAGVGLSVVKETVKLYKGQISVDLENQDTIHFKIILPLIEMEPKTETSQTIATEEAYASRNGSTAGIYEKKKEEIQRTAADEAEKAIILLVEDHVEVRQFLGSVWGERYHIIEAANGEEGIAKAVQSVPDLIISDVRMPICNGIELCNRIKSDERTSHIPIILLTADTDEEKELKGLRSGADDFVTKPFKLRNLQTRVENLIASRRALQEHYKQDSVVRISDVAITPTDQMFLKRLEKVLEEHLTNSEFNAELFRREIGMSRMQLHRKLLALTGLSTTAFIRSQRLKLAVDILKTSDATTNEVAYTVGFNTPSYFIKCFKAVYGKTPSDYLETIE